MKTLTYTTHINASPEKVWNTMLDKESYKIWTVPFNPAGSWYEGELTQGSKIHFLGPDPEDESKIGGMLSMVDLITPHEFISFKHLGEVKDGAEEIIQTWEGTYENYTFTPKDDGTDVLIELNVIDEFAGYMDETWPKALEVLKTEAEK